MTNEDFLDRLRVEKELYDLLCRMFRLVDSRRYDLVGPQCFTANAIIEYEAVPGSNDTLRFDGRDALTAYLLGTTQHQIEMHAHVIGQVSFNWSGDNPELSAYVTAHHWFAANKLQGRLRAADWTALGLVVDSYETEDGVWRIARRHVSNVAGLVVAGLPPPGSEAIAQVDAKQIVSGE
jgi:hypothetical protein